MKEFELFGKVLPTKNALNPDNVNRVAVKSGYIVHPDCCTQEVYDFLIALPTDWNNTFYNSIYDVAQLTREEIWIDQVLHYASTYGTQYQGQPYILSKMYDVEDDEIYNINFKDAKVILPMTEQELADKVRIMLYSGIALSTDTLNKLMHLYDNYFILIHTGKIRNMEAKIMFQKRQGILPTTAQDMVRFLVYSYTKSAMVIQNEETILDIKQNMANYNPVADITAFGIDKLSTVFLRYKDLFLAMKNDNTKNIINQLKRASKVNHTPMVKGPWEDIYGDHSVYSMINSVDSLTNFKKVRLMQALKVNELELNCKPYLVRNGKLFVKEGSPMIRRNEVLYSILATSLVQSLREQACKVKLPKSIKLALPTSEKSFIGHMPLGSYIDLADDNALLGIMWRGEDGAQDLDLSYTSINGDTFNWNSSFYNDELSIVYSGDMTSANPEASEYFYCANGAENGVLKVNLYNGNNDSKFTLFVGQTDEDFVMQRDQLIDQKMIKSTVNMQCSGKETALGLTVDNRFYFCDFNMGGNRVASNARISAKLVEYYTTIINTFVSAEDILSKAGFVFTDGDDFDIDLSGEDKSALISLLS
jgi:hypothetical protein